MMNVTGGLEGKKEDLKYEGGGCRGGRGKVKYLGKEPRLEGGITFRCLLYA